EVLARFLPAWHGIGADAGGADRLTDVVFQLQGPPLPARVIQRDVLAAPVRDYRPGLLDELVSMGEVVWVGRGSLGAQDGRVALYVRREAARLIPEPAEPPDGPQHQALRDHLQRRGACFFQELYVAAGGGDVETVL